MQEQNKVKFSRYAKIMSLMANLQKLKTRAQMANVWKQKNISPIGGSSHPRPWRQVARALWSEAGLLWQLSEDHARKGDQTRSCRRDETWKDLERAKLLCAISIANQYRKLMEIGGTGISCSEKNTRILKSAQNHLGSANKQKQIWSYDGLRSLSLSPSLFPPWKTISRPVRNHMTCQNINFQVTFAAWLPKGLSRQTFSAESVQRPWNPTPETQDQKGAANSLNIPQ